MTEPEHPVPPPSETNGRRCRVVVVGDLFNERYWVKTTASDYEPPISSIRGKPSITEIQISSGVELHRDILGILVNLPPTSTVKQSRGSKTPSTAEAASKTGEALDQNAQPAKKDGKFSVHPSVDELDTARNSISSSDESHAIPHRKDDAQAPAPNIVASETNETGQLTPKRAAAPSRIPTYVHQLEPFSRDEGSVRDDERVWRIADTMGLHELPHENVSSGNDARRVRREWLRATTTAINGWRESTDDLILVVNDRDQGFRTDEELNTLFESLVPTPKSGPPESNKHVETRAGDPSSTPSTNDPLSRLLIIWHPRRPFSGQGNDHFVQLLHRKGLTRRTIALVNHECLRDAGVNIRFDVSYEHTMSDVVDFSQRHSLFRQLMQFPQILIRYDYGVLHITTDAATTSACGKPSEPRRIISIDTHGMLGGPFYMSREQYGSVTGRTFLLVASIVRELCDWLANLQTNSFDQLLRLEGIRNDFGVIPPPHPLQNPLGDCTVPSIVRSTPLDRAIDLGILLNTAHFYGGYGHYIPGSLPQGMRVPTIHFDALFKEFYARVTHSNSPCRYSEEPSGAEKAQPTTSRSDSHPSEETPPRLGFTFSIQHTEPQLTRLCRLSMEYSLLESADQATNARRTFSRVRLLGIPAIMALRSPSTCLAADDCTFHWNVFEQSLRDMVSSGVEVVLASQPQSGTYTEPSVLVPHVRLGKHFVVLDRDEIDGFLSIKFLFQKYLRQASPGGRPLSIGVFGPPGSGKSFAVKRILESVGKSPEKDAVTFNVSQFQSLSDLAKAFHRIQDRALANQVPIAFFDEFDSTLRSESLGWLKYFLAPMQDGEFFDGNETFHLGPAIFVFGGGTASSFSEFNSKYKNASAQKAPDFISRLTGHLDIFDISGSELIPLDERLQVRRALALRGLLRNTAGKTFDKAEDIARIDDDIVSAFLKVKRFEHGKRSMEAIVGMSNIGDADTFQKSSLPTFAQLSMHVDANEFISLANQGYRSPHKKS